VFDSVSVWLLLFWMNAATETAKWLPAGVVPVPIPKSGRQGGGGWREREGAKKRDFWRKMREKRFPTGN
jgi:hypothetical protein